MVGQPSPAHYRVTEITFAGRSSLCSKAFDHSFSKHCSRSISEFKPSSTSPWRGGFSNGNDLGAGMRDIPGSILLTGASYFMAFSCGWATVGLHHS
ncbi:unnamed protein product, partial [Vitis vinifera]|uniref:Uncharacterized protein n=1 Tax=Vitis vinifera TaxID=29760 RepID=E0CU33_VITVI